MSEGRKDDAGKLAWWLLPLEPVREIVRVLQWAAFHKKPKPYGPDNWKSVKDAKQRYYDAAMRHLTDWWEWHQNGRSVADHESGFHILAHAGCCIIFLLWFELTEKKTGLVGVIRSAAPVSEFCPKCDRNWKAHTYIGQCPPEAFCLKCEKPVSRHYCSVGSPTDTIYTCPE